MRLKPCYKVGSLPIESFFEEVHIQSAFSKKRRVRKSRRSIGSITLGPHRIRVYKRQWRAAKEFGLCCPGCDYIADRVDLFQLPGHTDVFPQLVIENDHGHTVPMTIDHILPRAHGGPNKRHNMWLMCEKCNGDKADKIPASRVQNRELVYMAA